MLLRRCLPTTFLCVLTFSASCFGQVPVTFNNVTSPGGQTPFSTLAVDLNNDGVLDIVTTSLYSQPCSITTSLSNGDGTFQPAATFYVNASPANTCAVASGDFNRDGKADLAIAIPGSNEVQVWLGNGDGTFQFPATSFIPIPYGAYFLLFIVAADFNHDGNADVIVEYSTAYDSAIGYKLVTLLLEGDGNGGFATTNTIFAPAPNITAGDFVVGDFDSDNNVDLAFVAPACNTGSCPNVVHVFYGDGKLGFRDTTPLSVNGSINIASGDLNSDGRTDLFGIDGATNQLVTLYSQKNGTFATYFSSLPAGGTLGSPNPCCDPILTMADFNSDGRMDLVASLNQGILGTTQQLAFFLAGTSPGQFTIQIVNLPSHQFITNPVIADFNRDTKPDILVTQADASNQPQATLVAAINGTSGGVWSNCNYPRQGQGLAICAPIAYAGTPANFNATASAYLPLRKIELWVDGLKIAEQNHTWEGYAWFNYSTPFSSGIHNGTFFAADIGNNLERLDFSFNVSNGPCPAPASLGVNICKPVSGSTTSSPVLVQAAANITGTLLRMELWVDGVKKYTEFTSTSLYTSVYTGGGNHRFDIFAVNTSGTKWLQTAYATTGP